MHQVSPISWIPFTPSCSRFPQVSPTIAEQALVKSRHDCCSPRSWNLHHDPQLRGPAATQTSLTRVSSGSLASHPTPRFLREYSCVQSNTLATERPAPGCRFHKGLDG